MKRKKNERDGKREKSNKRAAGATDSKRQSESKSKDAPKAKAKTRKKTRAARTNGAASSRRSRGAANPRATRTRSARSEHEVVPSLPGSESLEWSSEEPSLDPESGLGPDVEEAPELGIGSRMIPPEYAFTAEEEAPTPSSSPSGDVAEQIRALEARLDGLIRGARTLPEAPPTSSPNAAEAADEAPLSEDLSQTPYFEKHWGREALRSRAEEVDDFGLDPAVELRLRPLAEFLFRRYFRVRVDGVSNVPANGRCLLVANHSGTLPLDGLMLRTALRLEHPAMRELRWLAEDFLFYLPFAGVFMNRVGAVRACQENAERLLEKELAVAAFPEGVQGIKKLFRDRYRLQRFGRGGYVRLALRMQAPIVPCSIVGAEETNPLLYRVEYLASLVGLPYLPVTPTFPLLGPLGLLPAPSRWHIRFGEPVSLDGHGPQSADDHVLVGRLSERVRTTIQGMLETGLRERRSVWFG